MMRAVWRLIDDGPGAARRVQWITRLPTFGLRFQALDELIMNRTLHQQPRVGRADFALIEEDPERRFFCGQIQVLTIGEHQVRALAAALQPHLFEVGLRRVLHEVFADCVEPVNTRQSTSGCKPNALPVCSPSPGNTLSTPAGKPRFQRQLSQAQGRKR